MKRKSRDRNLRFISILLSFFLPHIHYFLPIKREGEREEGGKIIWYWILTRWSSISACLCFLSPLFLILLPLLFGEESSLGKMGERTLRSVFLSSISAPRQANWSKGTLHHNYSWLSTFLLTFWSVVPNVRLLVVWFTSSWSSLDSFNDWNGWEEEYFL